MTSRIRPNTWYFIKGENLILMRYMLGRLIEEIRDNDMSADLLMAQIQEIKDQLPNDPLEADFP